MVDARHICLQAPTPGFAYPSAAPATGLCTGYNMAILYDSVPCYRWRTQGTPPYRFTNGRVQTTTGITGQRYYDLYNPAWFYIKNVNIIILKHLTFSTELGESQTEPFPRVGDGQP